MSACSRPITSRPLIALPTLSRIALVPLRLLSLLQFSLFLLLPLLILLLAVHSILAVVTTGISRFRAFAASPFLAALCSALAIFSLAASSSPPTDSAPSFLTAE